MTCLWTPKVTLCSSSLWKPLYASLAIIYNICMCGSRSSHIWSSHVVRVHVRVWEKREFGEKYGKRRRVCLCCLSHAVSPYQPGSLTKARDTCQAVLDNCTWSECSWETKRDLRKLGLIRKTSPDRLSQSGIRPRCVHTYTLLYAYAWLQYPHGATVTLTYLLHHGNGQNPGGRPDSPEAK